jgi:hypothetical protein
LFIAVASDDLTRIVAGAVAALHLRPIGHGDGGIVEVRREGGIARAASRRRCPIDPEFRRRRRSTFEAFATSINEAASSPGVTDEK